MVCLSSSCLLVRLLKRTAAVRDTFFFPSYHDFWSGFFLLHDPWSGPLLCGLFCCSPVALFFFSSIRFVSRMWRRRWLLTRRGFSFFANFLDSYGVWARGGLCLASRPVFRDGAVFLRSLPSRDSLSCFRERRRGLQRGQNSLGGFFSADGVPLGAAFFFRSRGFGYQDWTLSVGTISRATREWLFISVRWRFSFFLGFSQVPPCRTGRFSASWFGGGAARGGGFCFCFLLLFELFQGA